MVPYKHGLIREELQMVTTRPKLKRFLKYAAIAAVTGAAAGILAVVLAVTASADPVVSGTKAYAWSGGPFLDLVDEVLLEAGASNSSDLLVDNDDYAENILFYSLTGGTFHTDCRCATSAGGCSTGCKTGSPCNCTSARANNWTFNKYYTATEFNDKVVKQLFEKGGELVLLVSTTGFADNDTNNGAVTAFSPSVEYIKFPKIGPRPAAPAVDINYLAGDEGKDSNPPEGSGPDPKFYFVKSDAKPSHTTYRKTVLQPMLNTAYLEKYEVFILTGALPAGATTPTPMQWLSAVDLNGTNSDTGYYLQSFNTNANPTSKITYYVREKSGATVTGGLPHAAGKIKTFSPKLGA